MEWEVMLPDRETPDEWSHSKFLEAVQEQLIKDFEWDPERVTSASISLLQLLEDHISWSLDRSATPVLYCFLQTGLRRGACPKYPT